MVWHLCLLYRSTSHYLRISPASFQPLECALSELARFTTRAATDRVAAPTKDRLREVKLDLGAMRPSSPTRQDRQTQQIRPLAQANAPLILIEESEPIYPGRDFFPDFLRCKAFVSQSAGMEAGPATNRRTRRPGPDLDALDRSSSLKPSAELVGEEPEPPGNSLSGGPARASTPRIPTRRAASAKNFPHGRGKRGSIAKRKAASRLRPPTAASPPDPLQSRLEFHDSHGGLCHNVPWELQPTGLPNSFIMRGLAKKFDMLVRPFPPELVRQHPSPHGCMVLVTHYVSTKVKVLESEMKETERDIFILETEDDSDTRFFAGNNLFIDKPAPRDFNSSVPAQACAGTLEEIGEHTAFRDPSSELILQENFQRVNYHGTLPALYPPSQIPLPEPNDFSHYNSVRDTASSITNQATSPLWNPESNFSSATTIPDELTLVDPQLYNEMNFLGEASGSTTNNQLFEEDLITGESGLWWVRASVALD